MLQVSKAWYTSSMLQVMHTSSMLQVMQRTTLCVAYLACCLGGGEGGGVIGAGGLHAITALAAASHSLSLKPMSELTALFSALPINV